MSPTRANISSDCGTPALRARSGYTEAMRLKKIIGDGLKTGLALAAATNAAIMLASDRELGAPWAAINAIAHVVDGDEVTQPSEYSPRESTIGILVNGTAMAAWGVLYEGALAVTKTRSSPFTGALGAAVVVLH